MIGKKGVVVLVSWKAFDGASDFRSLLKQKEKKDISVKKSRPGNRFQSCLIFSNEAFVKTIATFLRFILSVNPKKVKHSVAVSVISKTLSTNSAPKNERRYKEQTGQYVLAILSILM